MRRGSYVPFLFFGGGIRGFSRREDIPRARVLYEARRHFAYVFLCMMKACYFEENSVLGHIRHFMSSCTVHSRYLDVFVSIWIFVASSR
jgi:hypothetical protein